MNEIKEKRPVGRPRRYPKKRATVTFRLSPDVMARVKADADRKHLSVSEELEQRVVRSFELEAIAEGISNLDRKIESASAQHGADLSALQKALAPLMDLVKEEDLEDAVRQRLQAIRIADRAFQQGILSADQYAQRLELISTKFGSSGAASSPNSEEFHSLKERLQQMSNEEFRDWITERLRDRRALSRRKKEEEEKRGEEDHEQRPRFVGAERVVGN